MSRKTSNPSLQRHLKRAAFAEVLGFLEQTGFWTALFILGEKKRSRRRGLRVTSEDPIGIKSNDTVSTVMRNLELLGLLGFDDKYHSPILNERGIIVREKFLEILGILSIDIPN